MNNKPQEQDGGLAELKEWVSNQEIYTDPEETLDSWDLSEKGGYKTAMCHVIGKIDTILSRFPAAPVQDRLREYMKEEYHYTWDSSNESLLIITRKDKKPRLASHFEECLLNAIDKLDSRHHVAPVRDGLREAIQKIKRYEMVPDNDNGTCGEVVFLEDILDALSRHPAIAPEAVEPLAVLADRKGYTTHYQRYKESKKWRIFTAKDLEECVFWDDTYAEAESKARKYLSALRDKEEK